MSFKLQNVGRRFQKLWQSYKYRFMPWVSLKIKQNYDAESRHNQAHSQNSSRNSHHDMIHIHHLRSKEDSLVSSTDAVLTLRRLYERFDYCNEKAGLEKSKVQSHNDSVMYEILGFTTTRAPSSLGEDVGLGVFVQKGRVTAGSIVALYPGTLYLPTEPLFFASLRNPYILRCKDGLLVDGNDRGLSKSIYKSCSARDRFGWETPCSDWSWLTPSPLCPLNVGQYVNNECRSNQHNVIYQECIIPLPMTPNDPETLPLSLWRYLPNVWYNSSNNQTSLRIVPLVAVRDIEAGEELFSSYFTIVHEEQK